MEIKGLALFYNNFSFMRQASVEEGEKISEGKPAGSVGPGRTRQMELVFIYLWKLADGSGRGG